MAIQLGAAALLTHFRSLWGGEVRLLFEPAEETTGGARAIIDAGCLKGVSSVFALHMQPSLLVGQVWTRPGAMSGFSSEVNITIKGEQCHGAYPERGADAILTAAHVITALQSVVSRSVSPLDSAVVTIGVINGGTAHNIIAGEAALRGTLRTLREDTTKLAVERIHEITERVCGAFRCSCEISVRPGCSAVVCDEAFVGRLNSLAAEIGVEALTKPTPSLGVDSFGEFTANTRGLYYDLGCVAEHGAPQIHMADFDIDERCLHIGAHLQAALSAEAATG